jgi:hypothetical protein
MQQLWNLMDNADARLVDMKRQRRRYCRPGNARCEKRSNNITTTPRIHAYHLHVESTDVVGCRVTSNHTRFNRAARRGVCSSRRIYSLDMHRYVRSGPPPGPGPRSARPEGDRGLSAEGGLVPSSLPWPHPTAGKPAHCSRFRVRDCGTIAPLPPWALGRAERRARAPRRWHCTCEHSVRSGYGATRA